jgi:hypothetical protein
VWRRYAQSIEKIDYKYKPNTHQAEKEEYKSLLEIYEKIDSEDSAEIEKLGGYLERALAYDAVWVMAYSLDKTLERY